MIAPTPPGVDTCSEKLASRTLDIEKHRNASFEASLASKKLDGVERAVENEFRSPGLEDASPDEASLRAFHARVHTSTIEILCYN